MSFADQERALRRQADEHRMAAPNARDFPSWEKFSEAQAAHEARAAEIDAEIEAVVQAAWA
jgi:hypothetical protein